INNSLYGIYLTNISTATFGSSLSDWNDIYGNGSYELYNDNYYNITAQYIYWGSTDANDIENSIYHKNDNSSLGYVNFNPWTNAAHNALFPFTGLYVDIKLYLEGPFNGTNMNTDLNPGDIPLSQPYNTPPWNYAGTESVASIPNADVVDWILIELRDTTDAALATGETMIAQQAAFLLNNGSVVGLDGSSILSFNHSIIHSLFVVIWHRNHLGVMSAYPLTETGGVYIYDFTTGAGQAYGGANGHKEIGTGVWGMIGGDGDANSQIGNADKNDVWAVQAGTSGYLSGDFTMDVQVNNSDKNDVWALNSGKGSQVPNEPIWNPGDPFTDTRDGQTYNTVVIGSQCWMAENLNIGTMINGIDEQTDNDTIEKYCYGDSPANCDVYGGLYQWDEMMEYTPGTQGICPTGWHLPNDIDWKQLEGEVDSQYGYPDPEWNGIEYRGFDAGLKLKSTSGWNSNGNGTDEFGFTSLPSGFRFANGGFYSFGTHGGFWTSSAQDTDDAWHRALGYNNEGVYRYDALMVHGRSVRCLHD
ncbi:MAG: fibrobacter succinogenes major paralogous domain-containing protein, partial [Bacteroidales bacterium]|nr:fibrobacter succinogenes major paralogous domain-containing protein [Bacteroidales bacterium]